MKKFIIYVKLGVLMLAETCIITYPVAALTFWLAYLGDMWFGQHLMVNTADKWFIGCLCLGLAVGLVYTIWRTRYTINQIIGKKQSNQEVK